MKTQKSAKRYIIKRIGLILIVSVVWLILLETLVRMIFPIIPRSDEEFKSIFIASDNLDLNYEMRRNFTKKLSYLTPEPITYTTNSQGFRDTDFVVQRTPGKFRIAILGDSITFGLGVQNQDSFPVILERQLDALRIPTEVYNFGVGGYNTLQEYALLTSEVLRYSPDLVILGYALNDADKNADWFFNPSIGRLTLKEPPEIINNDRGPLGGRFAIVGPALDQSQINQHLQNIFRKSLQEPSPGDRAEIIRLRDAYTKTSGTWVDRRDYLKRMASVVASVPAKFLVAVFPLTYQLKNRDNYWEQQVAINQFLNESQIPTIDILPILEGTNFSPDQLFLDSGHFTKLGNTVTAQSLIMTIFRFGLLVQN